MITFKNKKTSNWATIISGQPRAKLIEPKEEYDVFVSGLENTPDIFGHMWECEKLLSCWGDRGWLGAARKQGETKVFSTENILNLWDLHACLVENYDDLPFKKLPNEQQIQQGKSQWYGIRTAYQIMEDFENSISEKYDFVMRYRYDLEFAPHNQHKQPNWKLIEKMLTDDPDLIIGDSGNSYDGFGDVIAMGTRDAMMKYSKFGEQFLDIRPNYSNNESATEYYLKEVCGLNPQSPWNLQIGIHR